MEKLIIGIDQDGYLNGLNQVISPREIDGELVYIIPNGFIDVPLPRDKDGNQYPFYRPKWNGENWIEDASQEEIDELTKSQPSPPSDSERIAMLEETILFLLGGI